MDWLRKVVEWGDELLDSCDLCRMCRFSKGSGEGVIRETCFPEYRATAVRVLEDQRYRMAIALAGEFVVITFRLLSGHPGGCLIGLAVFVVGNKARCSLHSATLTAYICLGFGTAAMDAVDLGYTLVAALFSGFAGFSLLDFSTIAALLAPAVEFWGARCACDSFLKPEMLFQLDETINIQYAPQASMMPNMFAMQSVPPQIHQPLPQQVLQHEMGAAYFSANAGPVYTDFYRRSYKQPTWNSSPSASAAFYGSSWNHSRRRSHHHAVVSSSGSDSCNECGQILGNRASWQGGGPYAGKVFCEDCWNAWA